MGCPARLCPRDAPSGRRSRVWICCGGSPVGMPWRDDHGMTAAPVGKVDARGVCSEYVDHGAGKYRMKR
ncbi:hypothetical protein [Austwickia chelonae]|uniref:hypothetical protein n=1 Tax=Austwickia chelonae TaxID=100225 RepID=UPI001160A8B3|nr:hypothetical protein [Austwickia chelonae]